MFLIFTFKVFLCKVGILRDHGSLINVKISRFFNFILSNSDSNLNCNPINGNDFERRVDW